MQDKEPSLILREGSHSQAASPVQTRIAGREAGREMEAFRRFYIYENDTRRGFRVEPGVHLEYVEEGVRKESCP